MISESKIDKKEVKTPAYWKEDQFQPLVEAETLYGNKVKIPSRSKESWDFLTNMSKTIISEQGRRAGLKIIKESLDTATLKRSKECEDFYKVFTESYQEPN